MKVLAFDPSVENLGWAVATADAPQSAVHRVDSGCWHPSKRVGAADRFSQLAEFVAALVRRRLPDRVAFEVSSGGAFRGRRPPAALMAYYRAVGTVCGAATVASGGVIVQGVEVRDWKAQTGKQMTLRIVSAYMSYEPKTDHEADALGLCMWLLRQPSSWT